MFDKKSTTKSTWGSRHSTALVKNGKRKFTSSVSEPVKKTRKSKGPLTTEEFARTKKEKLCFQCLSDEHSKQDCPQLKGNEKDKGKGKAKAVHMVQVLPLDASPKYATVEVSHTHGLS